MQVCQIRQLSANKYQRKIETPEMKETDTLFTK